MDNNQNNRFDYVALTAAIVASIASFAAPPVGVLLGISGAVLA
jgi:uncharacterized protein (DUF58 family)